MNWLGLDIGGANIKAASTDGKVYCVPFRFWTEHQTLGKTLSKIVQRFPQHRIAATMTAELADCFESRQVGVEFIVDCLDTVCRDLEIPAPVYAGTDLQFLFGADAKKQWLKTAASNWAMLAAMAGRFLPQRSGLVIDMGSTTTDIIPVRGGEVAAKGKTDVERLQHGELVYVGVNRTPVCSVVQEFALNDVKIPIAREYFATVDDAMLLCEFVVEDESDCDTADGRARTKDCAARRICKMICEDVSALSTDAVRLFAEQVLKEVERLIVPPIQTQDPQNVLCAGSGVAFLVSMIKKHFPNAKISTLDSFVEGDVNQAAPAYAVAVLASERLDA